MSSIEKHKFTITISMAVLVVLFIISTSIALATWKAEVCAKHKEFDDRITCVGEKHVELEADIESLEERANAQDVQYAKISTQLAGIQLSLLEIKQSIKEEQNP